MRLTAELISFGQVFMNTIRERQLSLRGYKIPSIENLGATQDQFDHFDFSDNELMKIENFPLLKRLASLTLNNNKISVIADGIGVQLPRLDTLLLSNNKFSQLAELEPLADLPRLERLSLLGNPVTRQPHYRLYVIALLPKLRLLDFNKVKAQERLDALKMFGVIKRGGKGGAASAAAASSSSSSSSSSAAASASASAPAKTFVPGGDLPSSSANSNASSEVRRLTPELKEAIKVGIANAQTMEEIDALEKALSTGRIPRSLASRLNLPVDEPAAASSSSSSTDADMGQ